MKKYLLYMAVLAVTAVTAGCSSDEELATVTEPEAVATRVVRLTATLGPRDGEVTRSVDQSGLTTWNDDEEIAVYYEKTDGTFDTAKAVVKTDYDEVTDKDIVTFEADLKNPKDGSSVRLVYPYSLANDEGGIDETKLLSEQVGTIRDISTNWDAATADDVTLTVSEGEASLGTVSLKNQLCIYRLVLNDEDGETLTVRKLEIVAGSRRYSMTLASPYGAGSYVALLPISAEPLTFTVTTESGDVYTRSYASVTLEKKKLYSSTVKLRKYVVGKVIGSDGNLYATTGDVPEGYEASAMVAYVGPNTSRTDLDGSYSSQSGFSGPVITYDHGLAIALTDVSSSKMAFTTVPFQVQSYSRTRPGTASGWFLPTTLQWMRILNGCGSASEPSTTPSSFSGYGDFRTLMTTCNGTDVQEAEYWTASSATTSTAYYFNFSTGKFATGRTTASGPLSAASCYVRSAFAF